MQAARLRVLNWCTVRNGTSSTASLASRFIVDSLCRFGFWSLYNEVQAHNMRLAVDQETDIPNYNDEFVQYKADNVDHDLQSWRP